MSEKYNLRGEGHVMKDGARYDLHWTAAASRAELEEYARSKRCQAIELAEWLVPSGNRFAGTHLFFSLIESNGRVVEDGPVMVETPDKRYLALAEFLSQGV